MKIITSYKDAYELALPYINTTAGYPKKMHTEPAPKHATSSRWLITKETLHNTLQYIFEGLAHNCYMLCVGPDEKTLCKLECLETPERFESAVKAHLKKLPSNKLITGEQRDKIRRPTKKPFVNWNV